MDVDGSQLNDGALKLALEIMFLLTGEVYIIIKKLGDGATSGSIPHVSEGWSLAQNTLLVPSPHSETNEKSSDEKILELTKKIIALLTREVPMRSQDVTVYFSMEEWEYLEEHNDFYRDITMDYQQTFISTDGSVWTNTEPEARPVLPQSCQENHNGTQDQQVVLMDGVMKRIKVEAEDAYHISSHPCKEEVVPSAICQETSGIRNASEGCPINPYVICKTEVDTGFMQTFPHSHLHPPTPESVFRDLIIYKDRSHINKRILDLTMEIIYLLSRGDYVILKSSGEHVIPSGAIHGLASQSSMQSPLMLSTPNSLTRELHNEQKILEVTNKLNELLTGEVPLRCQDVTVYFSVEEWEYFEQHKDLYMKRFTSPGQRTSQGFLKRDDAPCRNSSQNTPYSQPNTAQGDTDFSDSEEDHHCVWDTCRYSYHDQAIKVRAWEDVAKSLIPNRWQRADFNEQESLSIPNQKNGDLRILQPVFAADCGNYGHTACRKGPQKQAAKNTASVKPALLSLNFTQIFCSI
ncbi:uncharacterized protein [Dendrobates tinctorius]|uniref:uncharacterized protein n=1 Tax=Dendrobates tinctorius TaxID=92724 RepID=UPI003CCA5E8D